jgi:hypothetical protein
MSTYVWLEMMVAHKIRKILDITVMSGCKVLAITYLTQICPAFEQYRLAVCVLISLSLNINLFLHQHTFDMPWVLHWVSMYTVITVGYCSHGNSRCYRPVSVCCLYMLIPYHIVISSQVLFHDGSLLLSQFNTHHSSQLFYKSSTCMTDSRITVNTSAVF